MPLGRRSDPRTRRNHVRADLGWIALAAFVPASGSLVLAGLSFGHATRRCGRRQHGPPGDRLARHDCRLACVWPELVDRLKAYAAGEPVDFADVAIDLAHLSPLGAGSWIAVEGSPTAER